MNQTISLSAPAKVNLFLRVLRRRSDGFHELETVFQAIDYCDDVLIELNDLGQISLEVAHLHRFERLGEKRHPSLVDRGTRRMILCGCREGDGGQKEENLEFHLFDVGFEVCRRA